MDNSKQAYIQMEQKGYEERLMRTWGDVLFRRTWGGVFRVMGAGPTRFVKGVGLIKMGVLEPVEPAWDAPPVESWPPVLSDEILDPL